MKRFLGAALLSSAIVAAACGASHATDNDSRVDDATMNAYVECLRKNATFLALGTQESADLVRDATFAACRRERNTVIAASERSEPGIRPMLDIIDRRLAPSVLLTAMEARANKNTAAQSTPAAQEKGQPWAYEWNLTTLTEEQRKKVIERAKAISGFTSVDFDPATGILHVEGIHQ